MRPLNLEGQAQVFISPRNRVVQLYTLALGSLFVLYYYSQSPVEGTQVPESQIYIYL
jgi:hypothetical protein